MKFNRVVVLAAVLLGMVQCGKSSSEKSDGINADKLKGIWQLTQVKRIVEEQSGEGEAATTEDKAQDPQDVEEDKSRFVLISVNKVNMMDAQTNSEPCDLDRDYEVSGRELNLVESEGCVANRLEVHKQEDDKIELSGLRIIGDFGKAKSLIYIFERINVAGMRIHFKSLNLAAGQYPSAYNGYMKDQEKNDPEFRAPKDGDKNENKTERGGDRDASIMFYPTDGKADIPLESLTFNTAFEDHSAYYQSGKLVKYSDLKEGQAYCNASKESGGSEVEFPYSATVESVNADRNEPSSYNSTIEETRGAYIGVYISLDSDYNGIYQLTCRSADNAQQFSMADLKAIVGRHVSVKY